MKSLVTAFIVGCCALLASPALAQDEALQWRYRVVAGSAESADPLAITLPAGWSACSVTPSEGRLGGKAPAASIRRASAMVTSIDLVAVPTTGGVDCTVATARTNVHISLDVGVPVLVPTPTAVTSAALQAVPEAPNRLSVLLRSDVLKQRPALRNATRLVVLTSAAPAAVTSSVPRCASSGCDVIQFDVDFPSAVTEVLRAQVTLAPLSLLDENDVLDFYEIDNGKHFTAADLTLAGGSLARWVIPNLKTTTRQINGAAATVAALLVGISDPQKQTTVSAPLSSGSLARFLVRPGLEGASVDCSIRQTPATSIPDCAQLIGAPQAGAAPTFKLNVGLPVAGNQVRQALDQPSKDLVALFPLIEPDIRIAQTLTASNLDPYVEVEVEKARCDYKFTQITSVVPGMEHADVLFEVTASTISTPSRESGPSVCPLPTDAVVGDSALSIAVDTVQAMPTRTRPVVAIRLSSIPDAAADKQVKVVFKLQSGADASSSQPTMMQIGRSPRFDRPTDDYILSRFVASGHEIQESQAPPEAGTTFGEDFARVIGETTGCSELVGAVLQTTAPPPPGHVAIPYLATDRDSYLGFDIDEPASWSMTIRSVGAHQGCGSDRAPKMTYDPNAKAFCVHARREAETLDLFIDRGANVCTMLLPAARADTDLSAQLGCSASAQTVGMRVQGGTTSRSIPVKSRPYRLAVDLTHDLELICGGSGKKEKKKDESTTDETAVPLTSHSPIRAVPYDGMTCTLTLSLPQTGDSECSDLTGWDRLSCLLKDWGAQRLRVALAVQNASDQQFTPVATVQPEEIVLNPDLASAPEGLTVEETKNPDTGESAIALVKIDLTQRDTVKVDEYGLVRLTVTHENESDYRSDAELSHPKSKFEVTVRRKPRWGVLPRSPNGWDWRVYATIPVSLTLLRVPSSGSTAHVSTDLNGVELAGFGVGAMFVFEPWNFDKNEPIWGSFGFQFHAGIISNISFDNLKGNGQYPSLSMVAGIGFRLPPTSSPTGSGGKVEAALNAVAWYELGLLWNSPQWQYDHVPVSSFLFGIGGQFGSLGN